MLDFVPNHMGLGHPWVEDHFEGQRNEFRPTSPEAQVNP